MSVRQRSSVLSELAKRAIASNERGLRRGSADTDVVKPASTGQVPASHGEGDESSGDGEVAPDAKVEGADKIAPPSIKPLDIVVPDEIDRYAIGRRIGSGTCGVVHQALDKLLGREVAIKLSPMGEAHLSTGKVPGAQRAYQTEIIAAGRLTHQNIVTVHDAGQVDGLNYLVMEVVEGKSLREYGKGKTLLPVHEALRIIAECCIALDYSHKQGILHRDIKPANIMLADNGMVKLLDFGIAVGLNDDGELNGKGPTLGTPNYMSPEQILGLELAPSSDFYSVATVLFELLTGRQLFKAKKVKELFRIVVHKPAPRLSQLRPDLPQELSNVLSKALEKKAEARYQSGQEMARALRPFIEKFGLQRRRPQARQNLVRRLQQQHFFKSFSGDEIAQLLDCVQLRKFSPNDTLAARGTTLRRLLVITDGVASVRDQYRHLRLLTEGESLGEGSFISGAPATHDVIALTDIKALELSAGSLSKLPTKLHLHFYRHVSALLRNSNAIVDVVECDLIL